MYWCDVVELFLDFIAPSKAFRSTRTPIWTYVLCSCFSRQSLFWRVAYLEHDGSSLTPIVSPPFLSKAHPLSSTSPNPLCILS
jgi:hypothetical protein